MTSDAIQHYHDLLAPDVATESWEALQDALRGSNLVFNGRAICTVIRPYFLSPDEEATIQRAAASVVSALHKTFARVTEADYESVLGLSPREAELARIDAGFSPSETIARLDGFWMRDGGFGFVEFNAESPGGIAFGSTLASIFAGLPVMRRFAERYSIRAEPVLDHTLDALVAAYRQWGGTEAAPRVAIVDWRTAPTYTEFEICRDSFRKRGVAAEIVDPAELEYSANRLRAGEFEIDIVYRRIVASDVAANLASDHPLVAAARNRAACIASGFSAFAIHSKAMFALLSDPSTSPHLTAAERESIDTYVPWTRIMREGPTADAEGRRVDLVEYAIANRNDLVVKPATDYGGSGVYLGWTLEADAWERALRGALDRPSVLQRRVGLPSEPFPTMVDGRLELVEYLADIDPYSFHGHTSRGAGTRLSRSQLLNVTAGGGSAAPVFVVSPRA